MLPKIDVPIYDLTLPLSKKNIKFRPFLVKEEKILLMAVESQDENAITLAIKQILNNCCITELNVEDLPILDLEFFFLNLIFKNLPWYRIGIEYQGFLSVSKSSLKF